MSMTTRVKIWKNNILFVTTTKMIFLFSTPAYTIIILCAVQSTRSDYTIHPDWENPDAFSQRKPFSSGKTVTTVDEINTQSCQKYVMPKDDHLPSPYKKLVKFLMKRESMKVNFNIQKQKKSISTN